MGQRFRLKASFDISGFSADNQVILKAMKKYGIILADNGSPWYISGTPNQGWNDDDLHQLQNKVHGYDFEAVNSTSLIMDQSSGQAKQICASNDSPTTKPPTKPPTEPPTKPPTKPPTSNNCGDGRCNRTIGETINTCFKDCCRKRGASCNTSGLCCSKTCRTGKCA
jgi:hypothetical protein